MKTQNTDSYHENRHSGFTLVELIVVITILVILGAIAFVSLRNYALDARDSKRITNVRTISQGFDLKIVAGKPIVTEDTATTPNIALSGSVLMMTGYYGDINTRLLVSLGVSGNDLAVSDGFQSYKYSYFPTDWKYQIMALLEDNGSLTYGTYFLEKTYAETQMAGFVYIRWNFTATGGIEGLLPKPVSWETISGDPKVLNGTTEVLKTGDSIDRDPLANLPRGTLSGYAYSEAFGWIDFSYASIDNTAFSGVIWSEGIGWIDFTPASPNTLTLAWNTGVRKWNGKIWSESLGWIDFHPDSINQVSIQNDGSWKWKAWSEAGGWIDFDSGSVH